MPNQTAIVNRALVSHLGAEPVLSLSEDTKAARVMRELWPTVLEGMVSEHPWGFALRRVALARLAEDPAFGFSYRYALPADCLYVVELFGQDETSNYRIEAGELLCDYESVSIRYVARVSEPGALDVLFAQALSARLAAEAAMAITQNLDIKKACLEEYQHLLVVARNRNRSQGTQGWAPKRRWAECR